MKSTPIKCLISHQCPDGTIIRSTLNNNPQGVEHINISYLGFQQLAMTLPACWMDGYSQAFNEHGEFILNLGKANFEKGRLFAEVEIKTKT
jgi:hypothetical protein